LGTIISGSISKVKKKKKKGKGKGLEEKAQPSEEIAEVK